MKATVGIDPGHGGNSSGTYTINTVKDGLFERDFTLEQALLIEKHLLRNGFKTVPKDCLIEDVVRRDILER